MAQRTWWKFSPELCDQPEVRELAELLQLPAFAAAGAVALLYAWAVNVADDSGSINDYTVKAIESACRWDGPKGKLVNAFHVSGVLIGDLEERDDSDPLRVAQWSDVAGDIVDKREQARQRQRRRRDNVRDITQPVTRDNECDITQPVTRTKNKELRTKELRIERVCADSPEAKPSQKRFAPPSQADVIAFMIEYASGKSLRMNAAREAEVFMNHYEANGWKVGRNPMKDWHAAARNWLSKTASFAPVSPSPPAQPRRIERDVADLNDLYP